MPESNDSLVSLSTMSLGQKGLITAFSFDTQKGERIQEMGLFPGEQLEIVRLPLSGDPIEIKIRGYFFSLSKEEALHIKVRLFS